MGENAEARAWLEAERAREAANAPTVSQAVGGYPVNSPEEAAYVESSTSPQGSMIPGGAVRVAGSLAGGALLKNPTLGERAVEPIATAVDRIGRNELAFGDGYIGDLAFNAVFNEGARYLLSPVVSAAARKFGQSGPVQALRRALAGKVIGRVRPEAREWSQIADRMITDIGDAVQNSRRTGSPMYSSDALEARIDEHLPLLQEKGPFTVASLSGDDVTGSGLDTTESLVSNTWGGRGDFARQRVAGEELFDAWPKVFAAAVGRESPGPDTLARETKRTLLANMDAAHAPARGTMQAIESEVGQTPINIEPDMIDAIRSQVELDAKLTGNLGGASRVKIDPEGIGTPIDTVIGLVERATGKEWDKRTRTFVVPTVIKKGKKVAQLNPTETFTWSDIKILRGWLGDFAERMSAGGKDQGLRTVAASRDILRGKMDEVLDAADAAAGRSGSMAYRNLWEKSGQQHRNILGLKESMAARGWVQTLDQSGLEQLDNWNNVGRQFIDDVWPDAADIDRVSTLRTLMGGENSAQWNTLRRFKVHRLLEGMSENPDKFINGLADRTTHSREFWEATLGKDQYERVLDFGKAYRGFRTKNPAGSTIAPKMVEAGIMMRGLGPVLAIGATGAGNAALGVPGAVAGAGVYVVSTKQLAAWLTNPKDSQMFLSVMSGRPLKMKERAWLRNAVARGIAATAMNEMPDIRPVPATTTRENYARDTGRTTGSQPANYAE